MVTRVRVLQTCVLVLALCTACVQTPSPTAVPTAVSSAAPVPIQATVPSGDAPTLVVRDGTQGTIADAISIGAGNFWEDDYVDEAGRAQRGLTVGLWVTVKGDPPAQQRIRAHVGQTIRAGAYTLLVVEIQPHRGAQSGMPGGSSAFVRIAYTVSGTPAPARFEKADCAFPQASGMGTIECGYLLVPEDRTQPDGPLVELHVAIVRSSSPQPGPDPVVYLHGGFGGEALSMLQYQLPLFREVFAGRDVIVFDQRGGGFSRPSLNCPEIEDQLYQDLTQNLRREEAQQHYAQAAQACHDRLVGEGVNLAAYTSAANAADVNDLRVALGYAEWNLYGVSYGTRLALTVMRDFPVGVRSVILDSVYPPQVDIDAELAGNAERALDLLFERCAADAGCEAAYPDLKTVFYDTVAQLDADPLTVHLTRPKTGKSYAVVVNGDRLIRAVFQLLYSTDALPSLPKMIYELHAGRTDTFRQHPIRIAFSADYVSEGVGFSVKCSEETAFSSPQAVATANAAVPQRLRDASDDALLFTVCAGWGAGPAPAIENQPVASTIPTLILAGDSDPITPPRWAQSAAMTLSNSYYFEFRWVGHGVLGAGALGSCSKSIAGAFVAHPGSAPDSACLA